MTIKTSTLLFAALVLSSGACLAEAFTASNRVYGRSSSNIARFYAPQESLESNSPKRRRGRPRKTTTTPVAKKKSTGGGRPRSTSTAAAASVSEAEAVKRRSTKAKRGTNATPKVTKKTRSQKTRPNPGSSDTLLNTLLDHELLTKEEELALGKKIRRASQLKEAMAVWIEDNRSRIEQQPEYQRIESIRGNREGFVDSPYSSEENDFDNPLLGSASSQAMEQYSIQEPEEELFYQDGTPFDNEDMSYTVFKPQPQRMTPSIPESWMDDILLQNDDPLSVASILNDDDIGQALKLEGGRSELRSILLEGAMAREQLIRRNVKLVVSIAKKWVGDPTKSSKANSLVQAYSGATSMTGRPTLHEALQEGIVGLAEAAERYDPERGFRFSTYATMWVTNSIRKCFQLESTSGIRLPIPYYDIKTKYVTRVRHYLGTTGEVPSLDVLADDIGVSVKRLKAALQMTQSLVSLDVGVGGSKQGATAAGKAGSAGEVDGDYTLASIIACDEPQPEDICERSLLRQCLENAMATELTANERDVVRLRLGLDDGVPQTAKEVAEIFGGHFSQAAIRGMEQRALNKLRSPFGVHTQQLMAYLDFAGIDGSSLRR